MIRKVSRYVMGKYRLEYYYGEHEHLTTDDGWFILDLGKDEMNLKQINDKIEELVIKYTKEYRLTIDKAKPNWYEYKYKSKFEYAELDFLSNRAYNILSNNGKISIIENI